MSRPYNKWRFGIIDRWCKFYVAHVADCFEATGDVYTSEWDFIRALSRLNVVGFQLMMVRLNLRREGRGQVVWN